jgi:hypothetical protein
MKLVVIGYISKKTFGEICAANGHIITMKCNPLKCNQTAAFAFM